MTFILFLDFDGVLHPSNAHPSNQFCRAQALADCLGKHPDVEIVISSTWRKRRDLDQLCSLLPADLASRVIDKTPTIGKLREMPERYIGFDREAECYEWMRRNRPRSKLWVALDDGEQLFRPFSPHLVSVDPRTGFDSRTATRLGSRMVDLSGHVSAPRRAATFGAFA